MLSEEAKERLRTLTVEMILDVRAAYLRTSQVNVLKHWEMIQDRIRLASRTASSAEEWCTTLARSLQIGAPSPRYSETMMALTHEVREQRAASAWLDLVGNEWGFLMAMARQISERRSDERKAAAT